MKITCENKTKKLSCLYIYIDARSITLKLEKMQTIIEKRFSEMLILTWIEINSEIQYSFRKNKKIQV